MKLRLRKPDKPRGKGERGMALLTVLILGIVFSILGLSLYSMATYEWTATKHRDDSGSAFWLAEAAIEHAKGKLFNDITWDSGFVAPVALGEGTYTLTMKDSLFEGNPATWMYAQGFVPKAGGGYTERDVEVFAELRPAGLEYTLFAMDSLELGGNANVCGRVHGNTVASGAGSLGGCVTGPVEISYGFTILPPAIRTEHTFYPATTYYYVVGLPLAGTQNKVLLTCSDTLRTGDPLKRVFLRSGFKVAIIETLGVGNYTSLISYNYDTASANTMFNWSTGKCKCDSAKGDKVVVVNFGEYLQGALARTATLDISDATIRSTLINTRVSYADTSLTGLLNTANWTGGSNSFKRAIFAPENGIQLVMHDYEDPGGAQNQFGTITKPGVFYVTGSITKWTANSVLYGTVVALNTITGVTGTPAFWYGYGYQTSLPPYLNGFWTPGTSGVAEILLWREPPPKYGA